MTELVEIRPLKTVKHRQSHKSLYAFPSVDTSSDSSESEGSSQDESPLVLKLPLKSSKNSKRNNMIQTLPIIFNTQADKKKKRHHQRHIQQFLINTQPPPPPSPPIKKEIVFKQIMEPSLTSAIQYIPMSTPIPPPIAVVERKPFVYQRVYTPTFIEHRSNSFYNSYNLPIRRLVQVQPSSPKSIHLPKHAKKLVNRFLSRMEYAHGRRVSDTCRRN